jgi:hypothetical protein
MDEMGKLARQHAIQYYSVKSLAKCVVDAFCAKRAVSTAGFDGIIDTFSQKHH